MHSSDIILHALINISNPSLASLADELTNNKKQILAYRGTSSEADITIEHSLSTLATNSSSPNAPGCIAQLWVTFSSLQAQHSRTLFDQLIQQQRMMMIHHLTWNWLEHLAMEHAENAISSSITSIHWAKVLAATIYRHLQSGPTNRTLILSI